MKKHIFLFAVVTGFFSLSFQFTLGQAYSIHGPSEVDLSTCSPNGPTGSVTVSYWILRQPTITGPTNIRINKLPPDVSVSVSPNQLTYPGWVTGEQVTIVFTANAGVSFPDQVIEIEASDGMNKVMNQIMLHGTCPRHNKDFTVRGSFHSSNLRVVFPVEHAIVQIYRDRRWLADECVGYGITDTDGNFQVHLWADNEDTYYAKLRLNDEQGVYLHDWWNPDIRDYNSILRGSNSNPVIDAGNTLIIRDNNGDGTPHTAVWQGGRAAFQEFTLTNQSPPPTGDYEIVIQNTAGLSPWTARSTTNWEDGWQTRHFNNVLPTAKTDPAFDRYFSQFNNYATNFHEFGHALRHTVDGDQRHFTDDASRWTYGRKHDLCGSVLVDIEAFAFNEGWAEYWGFDTTGVVTDNCPTIDLTDMTKEGAVAADLHTIAHRLDACLPIANPQSAEAEMIRRRSMFAVINRGQNIMHSDGEFRSNFHQQFPSCIVPFAAKITLASDGNRWIISRVLPPATMKKKWLQDKITRLNNYTKELNQQLLRARTTQRPLTKREALGCDSCLARMLMPVILKGRLQYLQSINSAFKRRLALVNKKTTGTNYIIIGDDTKNGLTKMTKEKMEINRTILKETLVLLKKNYTERKTEFLKSRIADVERKLKIMDLKRPVNDESNFIGGLPGWLDDDRVVALDKHPAGKYE